MRKLVWINPTLMVLLGFAFVVTLRGPFYHDYQGTTQTFSKTDDIIEVTYILAGNADVPEFVTRIKHQHHKFRARAEVAIRDAAQSFSTNQMMGNRFEFENAVHDELLNEFFGSFYFNSITVTSMRIARRAKLQLPARPLKREASLRTQHQLILNKLDSLRLKLQR
jgi:hypothetical protein